jgi:hypothetical protein
MDFEPLGRRALSQTGRQALNPEDLFTEETTLDPIAVFLGLYS